MSTVSTHVLDSGTGRPAAGMAVTLEALVTPGWTPLHRASTDQDGRIKDWGDATIGGGNYRLIFDTGPWFAERGRECFYPEVIITFAISSGDADGADEAHYHVPLLLAAYAYSTYRGS
jgi:5-hydroxyisourate hydrolase